MVARTTRVSDPHLSTSPSPPYNPAFQFKSTVHQQSTFFPAMSTVGTVNGVKVSRKLRSGGVQGLSDNANDVADDPSRVVTVTAQAGKSGAEISISYTNCKVVGNGSFGVVFAAKMLSESACKLARVDRAHLSARQGGWIPRAGIRDCHQEGSARQEV